MNHLDVKPGNILLDENRNAVLIDFGLSKRYDEEGNQTSTTPVGISHGYAPLEQYKKGGVGTFSPATDIYSLGATLYKLLTGQTPPEATELMDEELPSLPANISPATVSAIKKAMQVGRKSRSQNIKEFLSLLGNVDSVMNEQPEKKIKEEVEEVTVFIETEMASQEDEEQPCTDNDKSDFIDGHEYVDLGLSVKWAACNIGAEKPEDYGDYFAWGETKPKMEYSESTYEYSVRKFLYYKYFDLGKNISDTQYDAAHANWGGGWRLPIKAELDELKRKCTWTWTTRGGHNGYKVTGPNGNSIFLPAAGYRAGALCCNIGKSGLYWDSTPHEKHMQNAYYLDFRSSYYNIEWGCRYYGLSLRPVIE